MALAGFAGVAVALGSRDHGAWHPGDRLRLIRSVFHECWPPLGAPDHATPGGDPLMEKT